MPLMDIATGRVIEEVKKRSTIWDLSSPYYKIKQARKEAWLDICCELVPEFNRLPSGQQRDIERAIQQRWKTARDAYIRSRTVLKKGAVLKKYFYYDRCSFLEKNAEFESKKHSEDEPPQKRQNQQNIVQVQPSSPSSSTAAAPASPAMSSTTSNTFLLFGSSHNGNVIINKQEPVDEDVEDDEENTQNEDDNLQNFEENIQNGAGENIYDLDPYSDIRVTQLEQELETPLKVEYLLEDPLEGFNKNTKKTIQVNLNSEICGMLTETTEQLKNDNMAFFMSLLPIVNKFSDRQKLLFRSEVIKAAMESSSMENDG